MREIFGEVEQVDVGPVDLDLNRGLHVLDRVKEVPEGDRQADDINVKKVSEDELEINERVLGHIDPNDKTSSDIELKIKKISIPSNQINKSTSLSTPLSKPSNSSKPPKSFKPQNSLLTLTILKSSLTDALFTPPTPPLPPPSIPLAPSLKQEPASSSSKVPRPHALPYTSFITKKLTVSQQLRASKPQSLLYTTYVGQHHNKYVLCRTPNFQDFIEVFKYIKDRYSLENYVKKISMQKGFRVIEGKEKGVTKREFRCEKAADEEVKCPFEVRFKKLHLDEFQMEKRYYLASYRDLHNHPLDFELKKSDMRNENKNSVEIRETLDFLDEEELPKYFELIAKLYGKEILHPKKRDKKNISKELQDTLNCSSNVLTEYFNTLCIKTQAKSPKQIQHSYNPNPLKTPYHRHSSSARFYAISLPSKTSTSHNLTLHDINKSKSYAKEKDDEVVEIKVLNKKKRKKLAPVRKLDWSHSSGDYNFE
ncbi:unnamed protein product [Moneuplotes crassus]|uniref:Uncharacterized protein n=1 Tax=Euplotes crassus TaxID=5936 RepID=A0AAD1U4Y3_EUPCR|nr:unnamed protein product [Moneuplotes crassus]